MAEAERLCAELRALAKERREDWKLSFHEKASTASAASARLREEWRSWREQLLAQEVAQLPDGHRVLLQALLCEMLSSYAELLPGFSVPPTPRERDSLAARLQQLASAAQAETLRRLADRPRQETSFRSAHTSMLLRKLDISEPPRRTKAVALEAAEALQGAVWTKAAVRIQAFCRGRWGRGWAYCWAPPFQQPRTAELAKEFARLRKRRKAQKAFELVRAAWSPALPVELMLLKAWQHEHEELLQRERFVQRATRRFEAQWTRYAEGLEAFARTQATERPARPNLPPHSGRGRFVHANGDVYEGQWLDDKAHGSGKFLHSDGSSYIGDWSEDMKSGQGLETWADGSTFKGEYRDGKKHGHGVFTSSDNSSYSGQFVNDSMHGEERCVAVRAEQGEALTKSGEGVCSYQGTYTFSDGRVYVGTWQDSQMTGNGTMRWPDGRWYEGGYLNDRKSGDGKFSWPDGRCYVGQWLEGKQHGTGRYIDAKGISREGLWKERTRND
eukprot:g8721.t1